ncbi:HTH_XRE domain containing protein [uncultured Caudovirales phage]|uniref:HTH_XRE domain containing protein n=1 Tax=uncultured Caudovirales phage TaxID=2100421 RepID=A0A6J5MDB8_9CAUD|nr:HTH_XRE domain containing protein [uncultured Caudovirales phage]
MPGKTLPYDVENNLSKYIRMRYSQLIMTHGGDKILVSQVENELCEYLGININTLKSYRHNRCIPSLPVALMIARYFGTDVTNIFPLNEGANEREEILQRDNI